jgi:toxin YoeB
MAKKVVWTQRAQNDRRRILKYWKGRNKSNVYSIKLAQLFKDSVKIISEFPEIGKQTDDINVRIKIVRDFYIFYEETNTQIQILTVWNTRQDPDEIK